MLYFCKHCRQTCTCLQSSKMTKINDLVQAMTNSCCSYGPRLLVMFFEMKQLREKLPHASLPLYCGQRAQSSTCSFQNSLTLEVPNNMFKPAYSDCNFKHPSVYRTLKPSVDLPTLYVHMYSIKRIHPCSAERFV